MWTDSVNPKRKKDMNIVKILIHGSTGKMGQVLLSCARSDESFTVEGELSRKNFAHIQVLAAGYASDVEDSFQGSDVAVDFSAPDATGQLVACCVRYTMPLVIGTTGHTIGQLWEIENHARTIPIVMASNFSTGVNVLLWLTRKAAEILGPGFDLEIVETHHRNKKDAPSGTAKTLLGILREVRNGQGVEMSPVHGREGWTGIRPQDKIGMHSVRGGDVVGDHTVHFLGSGERIELTHRTSDREAFARGALYAAKWVVTQPPGLYNMLDVLGLSQK